MTTSQVTGGAGSRGCGCRGSGVTALAGSAMRNSSAAFSGATASGTTGEASWTSPGSVSMERTRYFARQLVGPDDLTQDQLYLRQKLRRHNRMLHGWGIVCGARVRKGDAPCEVIVESGYVLGPYGDEIQIDSEIAIDVCREDLDGNVASTCGPVDPWCANVQVDRPSGRPVYLAVAYAECLSRPIRAVSDGCGCDNTACEYSRIRDSYRMVVLHDLPSTYPAKVDPPDISNSVVCPPAVDGEDCHCPACQPCPTEPWVILADLTVEAGAIKEVDCDSHRRYITSFRDYYYRCSSQTLPTPQQRITLSPALVPIGQAASWAHDVAGLALRPGDKPSVSGLQSFSLPPGAQLQALRVVGQANSTNPNLRVRVTLMRSRLLGTPQPAERIVRVEVTSDPFDRSLDVDAALATVSADFRYFLLATVDNAVPADIVTLSAFQIIYLADSTRIPSIP
jgi:hypothetical protein